MSLSRTPLGLAPLSIVLLAGCLAPGKGRGWVSGPLWVQDCKDGQSLAEESDFNLRADSFFGDPLFDTSRSDRVQRSSLMVRIQETASNIDEANGLLIQFYDAVQAAQAFVEGKPLALTDESVCRDCTDINTSVRMQLNLFVRCPTNKAPITAAAYALEQQQTTGTAREQECLLPTDSAPGPACPQLNAQDRERALQLCGESAGPSGSPDDGAFDDPGTRDAIVDLLGDSGSCLFLCRFGTAKRGEDPAALSGFEIDYGDTVAGFFSTRVLDTRAVRLNRCAGANGHLAGMFSFNMVRSRVAQPFP